MMLRIHSFYALPATMAPLIFLGTFIGASQFTPGYSNLSDTVSSVAVEGEPHAVIARTGFIVYGLLVAPLGFSFLKVYKPYRRISITKLLISLFLIYGFCDAVAGIATADLLGHSSVSGMIHDIAANAGFVAIWGSIFLLSWNSGALPSFTKPFSRVILVGTSIAGILFYLELNQNLVGLWQRCFFATTLAWVQIFALMLAFSSNRYQSER